MNVDVWHITHLELTIRIIAAAVLGGLIGLEREWNNHAAGFRTHILVCIGSASIMLLSIYGFSEFVKEPNVRIDPARLAAQVISGIGFLGAGAILRVGVSVSGLTTAASIWVVAAIGLAVGAGFFYCAILSTVMVLLSLFVLNKWEKYLLRHRRNKDVVVYIYDTPGGLGRVAEKFGEQGIQIMNLKMQLEGKKSNDEESAAVMQLRFSLRTQNASGLFLAIEHISSLQDVVSVESSPLPGQKKSSAHPREMFSNM